MKVYKVCPRSEWLNAEERGRFEGSAVDQGDGFIHLSSAGQLAETLRLHFRGQGDLVLVEFLEDELPNLVWEPSRNGQLFPHLYGALPLDKVTHEWRLELSVEGIPLLPW